MKAVELLNQYLIDIQHPGQMTTGEWLMTVVLLGIAGALLGFALSGGWYLFEPNSEKKKNKDD